MESYRFIFTDFFLHTHRFPYHDRRSFVRLKMTLSRQAYIFRFLPSSPGLIAFQLTAYTNDWQPKTRKNSGIPPLSFYLLWVNTSLSLNIGRVPYIPFCAGTDTGIVFFAFCPANSGITADFNNGLFLFFFITVPEGIQFTDVFFFRWASFFLSSSVRVLPFSPLREYFSERRQVHTL